MAKFKVFKQELSDGSEVFDIRLCFAGNELPHIDAISEARAHDACRAMNAAMDYATGDSDQVQS